MMSQASSNGTPAPIRVLLIDDEEEVFKITNALLKKTGSPFALDWVSSYDEGLQHLERDDHDAYLVDYHLGDRSGMELVRTATKYGCQSPIIMLTGRADGGIDQEAMKAGAAGYLEKGAFSSRQLERAVRFAVEHARIARELRLFRSAVEQTGDAIVISPLDEQGVARIGYVNPAFSRTLGYDSDELLGQPLCRLSDKPLPTQECQEQSSGESTFRRRDGTHLIADWTRTPIRDEHGHTSHFVTVLRDVSERKQLEAKLAQTDRLTSIGFMASGLSHEINNPLAYVLPNLSYALDELKTLAAGPERERLAQIITALQEAREGTERVRDIVRDMNTFSRVDQLQEGPVDLVRIVEKALVMTMHETRRVAQVSRELGPVPAVKANEGQLLQVLVNLILNATQAMDPRRMDQNRLRIVTRTDSRGRAVVEVHDTGTGIAAEHLPKLFKPFFTTKPAGQGTGLGLAICHSVVSHLGGEITVETKLGHGSAFRLTVPPLQPAATGATAPRPAATTPRKQVLIVDDEPLIAGALERTLGPGYKVTSFTRAEDALERLQQGEHFDVVLLDLIMPEMSGMELYAELQRLYPELCPKVVFLSGGAYTESAARFLTEVPNQRLTKPFDTLELRRVLHSM